MDKEQKEVIINKISSVDYDLWEYHSTGYRYTLDYNGLRIVLDKFRGEDYTFLVGGVDVKDKVKTKALYDNLKEFMDKKFSLSQERKEEEVLQKLFAD